MKAPALPFVGYNWRWATYEPIEAFDDPGVFLGLLRVWRENEGKSKNDESVRIAENKVRDDNGKKYNPEREEGRNTLRGHGQYWKAFDLLSAKRGVIELTPFGRDVADGRITQTEFATTIVKDFELPNRHIERTETFARWNKLRIKPLQLILSVMSGLAKVKADPAMSVLELVRIVIPLAGAQRPLSDHILAIQEFRAGVLDVSGWPNCTPGENDPRMAGEFLRFLAHYGFCHEVPSTQSGADSTYRLSSFQPAEIDALAGVNTEGDGTLDVAQKVRATNIPDIADRRRVLVEVLARPEQYLFRRNVFAAAGTTCAVTGATLSAALEAAHIRPFAKGGNDATENGLCLRADIHSLFDAGHLRVKRDGTLVMSDALTGDASYALPTRITLPASVSKDLLEWRWKYC